jgi:hypothetical protein
MPEVIAQPLPPPSAREEAIAFDDLYRRTFARVYAYVASLMRDASGAEEEVTAHAFERAYRKRASFNARRRAPRRGSSASPATPRSTSCVAADGGRRWRRSSRTGGAPHPRRRPRTRSAGWQCARERDLVALKFAAELGNAEIARVLGISASNAGTRLHRALEKLREACREEL